ncbi:MAG: hypothetical protein QY325_07210 [Flavobacteriales bacterium]|jgi:hypothetical protein|nr:MAG: hypothetical protein QY325_07210 [Flavobacteriales bacterium]
MERRISTRLAEMMLSDGDRIIEVRYRAGLDLDVEGLLEVQQRRGELTDARCAMLAFFQPGTLADLSVMDMDFFGATRAGEQLIALAIVTEDDLGEAMSSIYYSYHPQPFPTRMFRSEREARTWIAEQLRMAGI